MAENSNKQCEGCKGEITPNQIIARQAGLVQGVLLCPGCIARKREELMRARAAQAQSADTLHAGAPARATVAQAAPLTEGSGQLGVEPDEQQGRVWFPPEHKGKDAGDETLSLVENVETGRPHHQIRSFSEGSTLSGEHHDENFKRPLAAHSEPATRCRTFHGKLTGAGLAHMDEQINEWIDTHPDVFIKSSNSTVGIFEGKTKEPHLLVTVFY